MRVDVSLDDTEAQALLQALGPRSMGFALANATNNLAFRIRDEWKQQATRVFDRPTALTRNAALVRKAGSGASTGATGQVFRNSGGATAEIFLRDEAFKGTPPVKYLLAQVQGGARRHKRFERALIAQGVMPSGMFAMPGGAAKLDAAGNMSAGQIVQILSELDANPDARSNTPRDRKGRALKKTGWAGTKSGGLMVLREARNGLRPGIYQRFRKKAAKGLWLSTIEPLVIFTRRPSYRARYTVFDTAEKVIRQHGSAELERAVMHELTRAFNRAGRR